MVSGLSDNGVKNGLVCAKIQIALAIFCKNTTDTSISVRQINNFCSCLVSIHRCILVQLFAVMGCNKEIILAIRQQNTIRYACNVIADVRPRNTVISGQLHPRFRGIVYCDFAVAEYRHRFLVCFDVLVNDIITIAFTFDVIRKFRITIIELEASRLGEYIVVNLERKIIV